MSHCSPARGCLLNMTWTRFPPPHAALGAGPVLVMRSHAVRRSDNLQPDTRSEAPDDVRCHKTLVHRDHVRDTWQVWCCWASHMLRPTEGGHFVAGEWRHTRWPPQLSGHNVVSSSRNAADKSSEGWQLNIQRRIRWAGPRKAAMFKEMN